VGIDRELL